MVTIEKGQCVDCGSCIVVCPMGLFSRGEKGVTVQEKGPCIQCGHCTAACPNQCVILNGRTPPQGYPVAPHGGMVAALCRRRSVRHYLAQEPDRADINWALNWGQYVPSARNRRPYRWIVLMGQLLCDKLAADLIHSGAQTGRKDLVMMEASGGNLVTCGAPCLLLCCGPKEGFTDGIIALTTVSYLLEERQYATCWGGYLQELLGARPDLSAQVGLGPKEQLYGALMVGRSDGQERYRQIPYRPSAKVEWKRVLDPKTP